MTSEDDGAGAPVREGDAAAPGPAGAGGPASAGRPVKPERAKVRQPFSDEDVDTPGAPARTLGKLRAALGRALGSYRERPGDHVEAARRSNLGLLVVRRYWDRGSKALHLPPAKQVVREEMGEEAFEAARTKVLRERKVRRGRAVPGRKPGTMRISREQYDKLVAAFRLKPAEFAHAAAFAACDKVTAQRAWEEGWPEDGVPAISEAFLAEQRDARARMAKLHEEELERQEKARQDAVEARALEGKVARGAMKNAAVLAATAAHLMRVGYKLVEEFTVVAPGSPDGATLSPKVKGLPAGEQAAILWRVSQFAKASVEVGQAAMAMERLHVGAPTQIVGLVDLDRMSVADAMRQVSDASRAFDRAKAEGRIVDVEAIPAGAPPPSPTEGDEAWEGEPLEEAQPSAAPPPPAALASPASGRRTVYVGGPRTGKTTAAVEDARATRRTLRHTDSLIPAHDWSTSSSVVERWFDAPGSWVVEGVAAVRALRKWLRDHPDGTPCDEVVLCQRPLAERTPGQVSMGVGHETIWREVEPLLRARGVAVRALVRTGDAPAGPPPAGSGKAPAPPAREPDPLPDVTDLPPPPEGLPGIDF